MQHLVIPGHLLASANEFSGDDEVAAFLRGHGTYGDGLRKGEKALSGDKRSRNMFQSEGENSEGFMEDYYEEDDLEDPERGPKRTNRQNNEENFQYTNSTEVSGNQRLIASVVGLVERVNKLIIVHPTSPMPYIGQVGDLVVGRIESVASTRWKVDLGVGCKMANLPLSGVNLPGGVQRIRTSEDALMMRSMFAAEGDLVSAEVQAIQNSEGVGGTVQLHTRSLRYGKLENGCLVQVPPALILKMKQHFSTLPEDIGVDVLLGKNGFIWIQRSIPQSWHDDIANSTEEAEAPLAETLQRLRRKHADTPVSRELRENICRIKNSIEALVLVHCAISPDSIVEVYEASIKQGIKLKKMTHPEFLISLTEGTRKGFSRS